MQHVAVRHIPEHWNGTIEGAEQTFFALNATLKEVVALMNKFAYQHREKILHGMQKGGRFQVTEMLDGQLYTLGFVNSKKAGQFFPVCEDLLT